VDLLFSALPAYAELFVFSNFTFLHGASRGEELVIRASQLGYSGLAITDECSLAGVVRAHVQAKRPAFGLILLARNRDGYGNLSELITLGRTRAAKGSYLLTPQDIARPETAYAHLRGMPNCLAILIPDFPAKEEASRSQSA
jgi:error-prone DNA polymerase